MDRKQDLGYEALYDRLLERGEALHRSNQKRIRIGLIFLAVFTVGMILVRWATGSDRVVFMVLQIAGSSGSYPIEILPPVFEKIFRFFPFPYAINAMREALCGTYGHDFIKYLAELMLFAVLALAIGLLIRKPFMGMNRFVSEKLEETEVL